MTEAELAEAHRKAEAIKYKAFSAAMAKESWDNYLKYFMFSEVTWLANKFFALIPEGSTEDVVPVEDAKTVTEEWLAFRWGDPARGLHATTIVPQVLVKALMEAEVDIGANTWNFPELVAVTYYYQELHLAQEDTAGFTQVDSRAFFSIFTEYDRGLGLKAKELWYILKDLGFEFPTVEDQQRVIKLVKDMDTDRSGALDFTEFLHLLRALIDRDKTKNRKREHMLIARSGMDWNTCEEWLAIFQDCSGEQNFVQIPDMRGLFDRINVSWGHKDSNVMMAWLREVDEDSNGKIDFGEFCCLVQRMWDNDFANIRGQAKEFASQVDATPNQSEDVDEPTSPAPRMRKTRRGSWAATLANDVCKDLDPASPKSQMMVKQFEEALTRANAAYEATDL